MSLEHRLRLLASLGFLEALVIPFNKKFAGLTHDYFLREVLLKRLGMKSLSVGHDFRFGRGAMGDHRYLEQQSRLRDFRVFFTGAVKDAGHIVSSTRIRQLIERGKLSRARRMLGRPVSLYGTVVHGRGRGKSVGFPTANLDPHHETLPPAGVYAAIGFIQRRRVRGVVHIGERPTFGDVEKTVEAHFLDFHADLYGKDIELSFLARIRGIRPFASKKALARQIKSDIRRAEKIHGF